MAGRLPDALVRYLTEPRSVLRVAFLRPGGPEHAIDPEVRDGSFWTFCGRRYTATSRSEAVRNHALFYAQSRFACLRCRRATRKRGYLDNQPGSR